MWQADSTGNYDPPEYPDYQRISWDYQSPAGTADYGCRAILTTDDTGAFEFHTSECSCVEFRREQEARF